MHVWTHSSASPYLQGVCVCVHAGEEVNSLQTVQAYRAEKKCASKI